MDKSELQEIFTPKQYQVELFQEKGHVRKECSHCGHFFWTLDQERSTCGDTSCEGGYHFIDRKGPNWDFHQTINKLTDFFKKNGHTPIEAYPVVARWRDDLEFTIASIADFQPWVTGGTLPPPANPLTVPQPCLRFGGEFSDVDNVGRTGRHLTSFVMFGQHSFNSETLTDGYWMDRCLDLNFDFLTNHLKIKPEELTYVEGIWMGGGNFGPNLESFAFGSEIVNSVFMQYENTPSGYKEMDLKVIDVGWGTERVSWFSQGTSTIYDATFPSVLEYMIKESGVNPNQQLLKDYAKLAGLIDINEVKDVKSARLNIAESLGLSLAALNQELQEIEALYGIGDHARTLAFALADGALPSNVGGGYNVRTIIRRMFLLNDQLQLNLDLVEIIERSALYLSQSFPRVKESAELARTIIDVENERFKKTLKSGRKHVKQLIKSNKAIGEKTLFELYESRGIPPETVAQIASEQNVEIEVPMDFYTRFDQNRSDKHTSQSVKEEISLELLKNFETKMLYYDSKPKKKGEAKVEAILETGHVVLDQTIFYPIGGGQAEDHGWLLIGGQKVDITQVKKFGTAIVHKLSSVPSNLKVGSKVTMVLDWERRAALMRHHTAVHIVGGSSREVLGNHVWQAGADKTPSRGRLDITHWESISRETLDEIEFIANSVVMDNKKIKKHILSRTDAEEKYGFTIYQGGVVPGKDLRIIEIPGIDVEACGGTHANHTGEIGYIRILGAERIQDGIVRITLTAGKRAVEQAQSEYQLLFESAQIFSVPPEDLPQTSQRFFDEWKEQGKTIKKLGKEIAEAQVPLLIENAKLITTESGQEIRLIISNIDSPQNDLINLGEKFSTLSQTKPNLIAVIIGKYEEQAMIILARSKGSKYDLSPIIRKIGKLLGGGGGGKRDVLAGGGPNIAGIPSALKQAEKIIRRNL